MKKTIVSTILTVLAAVSLAACQSANSTGSVSEESSVSTAAAAEQTESTQSTSETESSQSTQASGSVYLAAAASLEKIFSEKLIPMFQTQNPGIEVVGTYDSSGKLQTQIEEGAQVDVFFSAANKQMDALNEKGMIQSDSISKLLENKIVLIVPAGKEGNYSSFEDIVKAENIAIGDPESVPAGQYAKEALSNLGLWQEVESKNLSLGTNVTEVLNWVAEGSADAGIVYATDAAKMKDSVSVIATAPEGSVSPVIYPAAIVAGSANQSNAELFLSFLKSEAALQEFENAGFTILPQ